MVPGPYSVHAFLSPFTKESCVWTRGRILDSIFVAHHEPGHRAQGPARLPALPLPLLFYAGAGASCRCARDTRCLRIARQLCGQLTAQLKTLPFGHPLPQSRMRNAKVSRECHLKPRGLGTLPTCAEVENNLFADS